MLACSPFENELFLPFFFHCQRLRLGVKIYGQSEERADCGANSIWGKA